MSDLIRLTPEQRVQVGLRLKQLREAKALTQAEVSVLFGWGDKGQTNVAAYEKGKRSVGRHLIQLYVERLGAHYPFIVDGTAPLFTPARTATKRMRGNLRLVRVGNRAAFCASRGRNGFDWHIHPLLQGENYAFEIDRPLNGPTGMVPAGSLLIGGPLPPRCVPAVGDWLVVRVPAHLLLGWVSSSLPLQLETDEGLQVITDAADTVLYQVDRIDAPVGGTRPDAAPVPPH